MHPELVINDTDCRPLSCSGADIGAVDDDRQRLEPLPP